MSVDWQKVARNSQRRLDALIEWRNAVNETFADNPEATVHVKYVLDALNTCLLSQVAAE